MGYFSTNGCTIGAAVLSDAQKNITNQATKGVAFVNPITKNIDGVSSSISGVSAAVGSTTTPAIFAGITGALATLRTNINSLIAHTERLSGVSMDASGPSGEPGIIGLIGTAKSYNSICESLTGGTEDNFSKLFGSVVGPGKYVLDTGKSELNSSVLNFVNYNSSRESADSAFNTERNGHITSINSVATNVASLITDDNLAYLTANQTIRNYSIGNILFDSVNDPCFTGKLLDEIASPSTKDMLNDLQ